MDRWIATRDDTAFVIPGTGITQFRRSGWCGQQDTACLAELLLLAIEPGEGVAEWQFIAQRCGQGGYRIFQPHQHP